jgi:hypothetical protein
MDTILSAIYQNDKTIQIIIFKKNFFFPPHLLPYALHHRNYRRSLEEVMTSQLLFLASVSCCNKMMLSNWAKCLRVFPRYH